MPRSVMPILASLGIASMCPGAQSVTVEPERDNSIYEELWSHSNGAGPGIWVGDNAAINTRRGLIAFDIASNIPPGATISSVELRLYSIASPGGASSVKLYRLLADWGEAGSVGTGQGAPAQDGDATWRYRFFDTADPPASPGWATWGGDYDPTLSAQHTVSSSGAFYTIASTPQLVADVQLWLDAPALDFGWLLVGDEDDPSSVNRFASREDPTAALRPALSITYEPSCDGDADGNGIVDVSDISYVIFRLGATGPQGLPGDANFDGIVDANDIAFVIFRLGDVCP